MIGTTNDVVRSFATAVAGFSIGRLLIVDIVMSDQRNVHDAYRNFLDVTTLTQVGGMERTESEFRTLLGTAGFGLNRVIRMDAPRWIVEALPA